MREWWRKVVLDYFTFEAGQRNGVIVLSIAILFAAFAPRLMSLFHKDELANFAAFRNEIDSFQKKLQGNVEIDSSEQRLSLLELDQGKPQQRIPIASAQLFSFDPNTATAEDFTKLGLGDKLIKTILNYRNKGGKFFAKEDFKKIYGLSKEDYNGLEPHIQIASYQKKSSAPSTKNYSPTPSAPAQPSVLDLNKADSIQLVAMPGIGPVLSSRILKFRDKLGGFYSVAQLKEVYGMTEDNFELAKEKISVNADDVKKISINHVSADDLKKHPYFKSFVMPLVNYREQHGDFKALEELKNIDVITEEVYKKIIPYLEI